MFTGLVQAVGSVQRVEERPFGVRLVIDPRGWGHQPDHGESIAVAGVCLTIAEHTSASGGALCFDVVRETLAKTTLGSLREGGRVNLERSVRPTDLLGGHLVQGHVDGVGRVTRVQDDPSDWRITIEPPPELMEYAAPKGSICIEGVSLTLAAVTPGHVEIALIPTTLEKTTLGTLREGDLVNIEMDMIARQVVHWLRTFGGTDGMPPLGGVPSAQP